MDKNNIYLLIDVNYSNSKFTIKKEELITYNELIEESIKYFNIDIKNGDNIEFIFIDEDKEKNILEHNDEDIFKASNFINNNYLLSLDLILINNHKPNNENKINKNDKQLNNNKARLNKEEENTIKKNEFEKKLKQVDSLFKNQFNLMQNDIYKMINKKYKEIENELIKIKLNSEANNINNTKIIGKEKIESCNDHYKKNKNQKEDKSNKGNENEGINFTIIDGNDEIIYREDVSNKEYSIIEKSTISPKNIIKEDENGNINKINDIENIDNDELNEEEENYFDKDDNMQGSSIFGSNNTNKIKDNKFDDIRKNINDLYKNKNYSYNDIITKGNKIFDIMNKEKDKNNKIEIFEINEHIKTYLTSGHKKDLLSNEKIKYCNILKYLNHFLEIKNIQITLDDKLKKEIKLEINNEKKNTEILKENTKDENKFISLIDSFNNDNKKYVQEKLEGLIKNLQNKMKKKESLFNF